MGIFLSHCLAGTLYRTGPKFLWMLHLFFVWFLIMLTSCGTVDSEVVLNDKKTNNNLNSQTGIYLGNSRNTPFFDIPEPFINFYRHCTPCHSNAISLNIKDLDTLAWVESGIPFRLQDARSSLNLNTWQEILSYSPTKLVLQRVSMPKHPGSLPNDSTMAEIKAWLVGNSYNPTLLRDVVWEPARRYTREFCAKCHLGDGVMDSYSDWKRSEKNLKNNVPYIAITPRISVQPIMPPDRPFPPKSLVDSITAWLQRGSPNTADGF